MGVGGERKQAYFERIIQLFSEYPCVLVAQADFVGSAHMQSIRKSMRQYNAILLMGKNTMIRKALRQYAETNPQVEAFLPFVRGNVGFIFCQREHLKGVRDLVKENRVGAPAKAGVIAPKSVDVPAGPTGLEPTQTSFFQALNIASKIVRSQIEILQEVHLIKAGDKVGNSEAALLQKLGIKPFSYGLEITDVYDDGNTYDAKVLDLADDDIVKKFAAGVQKIACISLNIGLPTVAALPHIMVNGYKKMVAIALATDYTFDKVKELKDLLSDPEALAKAQAAAKKDDGGDAKKEEVKKEESEEESEEDAPDFDLFG